MNRELWKWCAIAGLAAALLAPPLAAQNERSLHLVVTSGDDGIVKVWRDGKRVPAEQLESRDGKLIVRDTQGEQVLDLGTLFSPQGTKLRNKIGVNVTPISPALGAQLELEPDAALLIAEVEKDMPAARAGLQRYDVIVAIDGERPVTSEKLSAAVAAAETGATIVLEIRRAAKPMKLEVEVVTVTESDNLERNVFEWTDRWLKEARDPGSRWQLSDDFLEQLEFDMPDLRESRWFLAPGARRSWSRALPPPAELPLEATEEEIEIEQPAPGEGWRARLSELEKRLEKLEAMSRKQLELIETWLKRTEKGER